jgi:hypothetical protein
MKFEINFNKFKEADDNFLLSLGAKWVTVYDDNDYLEIELNTFEELEELLNKVNQSKNDYYAAIVSFDNATIFLDKDI